MPAFVLNLIASPPVAFILAQTALPPQNQTVINQEQQRDIIFWLIVIVTIGVITGIGGFIIWRQLKKREEAGASEVEGFSLAEMRRLYESGELSHDEYTTMRKRLVGESAGDDQGNSEQHVQEHQQPSPDGEETGNSIKTETTGSPPPPKPNLPMPPVLPPPLESSQQSTTGDQTPFANTGREDYGSVTARTLEAFEGRFELALPEDYRAFLFEQNGATPVPSTVHFSNDGKDTQTQVRYLMGVHDGKDWARLAWYIEQYNQRVPTGYLPVAIDSVGSLFLMSVQGPMSGRVYFWDHNLEHSPPTFDNMSFVAESFAVFIEKLSDNDTGSAES